LVVVINRQGRMMYRSTDGYWKVLANAGASDYKQVSDTLFTGGYTTRARTKQQIDSAGGSMGNLSGQDWIIYGDSYSDNLTVDYPGRVRDRLGLITTTKAKAGARIYTMNDTLNANLAANPSFLNDYDIISLHVGVNDFAASDRPLGKATDAVGADNIAGQFKYFIDTVLAKNPRIKFYLITPPEANGAGVVYQSTNSQGWTLRDLSLLISQIGALYSVQVIDLYNLSQLNLKTIPTMLPDGLHPGNPIGRNFMGDIVAQSFLSNSNKGKYADPYKVTNGYIPLYDGTTFKNSIIQADANRVTINGATTSKSSLSIDNTAIDSTLFLRVRNSQNDLYFGNNSISGAFFPESSAGVAVLKSIQPFEVTINGQRKTITNTSGFRVIGNISTVNGSITTDTGSVNVDSGNVNINIGSLNIDTGSVNVNQGNVNVSSGTPLLTLTSSLTSTFHGIEYKNGANIDAFIKHRSNIAELRISSGRGASWGGYTTFYQDGVERARFAPLTGALLINELSDNGVDRLRVNASALFVNRTRIGGGYIADIPIANNTGISFGTSAVFSIDGSAANTVKDLGSSAARWGTYYGSDGNFTSTVTSAKIIGNSSTPSISGGSATYIGTGATTSVSGNDIAGIATLITGTGCTSTGASNRSAFSVTFSSAYSTAPVVIIQAIQRGGLSSTDGPTNQTFFLRSDAVGTSGFTVYLPIGTTLTDSTTYEITYHVIGK